MNSETSTGYAHPSYAESFIQLGSPRLLRQSGAWIVERQIPGSPHRDAMGCYPLFVCQNWTGLYADLESIGSKIVSLALVTDPFGEYDPAYLNQCFPEITKPFKLHFVIELGRPVEQFITSHHRRNVDKSLAKVTVERCRHPEKFLDEWITFYQTLAERHGINGITAFSRESFVRQFSVPGLVAFRAVHQGAAVGMVLWYEHGNRAYYHLGAYSPLGYKLRASFALFDFSIRYFADRKFQWLSLGAGTGIDSHSNQQSGLTRFKSGWSTGTRIVYFCGRIFERKKYQELVAARCLPRTEYFPAYRAGEFN